MIAVITQMVQVGSPRLQRVCLANATEPNAFGSLSLPKTKSSNIRDRILLPFPSTLSSTSPLPILRPMSVSYGEREEKDQRAGYWFTVSWLLKMFAFPVLVGLNS